MAMYRVVEVANLDSDNKPDFMEVYSFFPLLGEICSAGWQIVSTKLLNDEGAHRYLVLLSR